MKSLCLRCWALRLSKNNINRCKYCIHQPGMTNMYISHPTTCKFGFDDCINDPGYIYVYHPEWYKELYGDKDYVEASESNPFIKMLNESCNMYRCFISVFLLAACCKIYDCYISEWFCNLGTVGNDIKVIVMCLIIALLFAMSYKKQVDYIRARVEKYIKTKK